MLGGFVRVAPDRAGFVLEDGSPFAFAGANCYYLLTRAADPSTRHECIAVLDDAVAAGLTVLRCWAFADGEQWSALQPRPGVFDESVFRALDWVVAEAGRRGLRLLLVLTNYWRDYGGMRQYVAWAWQARGQQPPMSEGDVAAEPFYTDPDCQRMFRSFLHTLVHRVNSLTGAVYRDDPAILAWGLANEPGCSGDAACATIPRWAHEAAAFLKGLDPNHLVTLDTEGFLGPSTPSEARAHNPYDCSVSGCDFGADCGSPAVDFACAHLYPDLWLPNAGEQERLAFSLAWLDCHVALARRMGKPLVLSEFGKRRSGGRAQPGGGGSRSGWYQQLLGRALEHLRPGGGLAGTAFWLIAAPSYPDYDGFTVYFSSLQPSGGSGQGGASWALLGEQAAPGARRTAAVIKQHAAAVAELNRRQPAADPPAAWQAGPAPLPPAAVAAINPLVAGGPHSRPQAGHLAPSGQGHSHSGSSPCRCCSTM